MSEGDFVALWASAFALTMLVELPCAVWLLRPSGAPLFRRAGIVVAAQFATHPVVWFVIPALHLARWQFLTVAESWAWLAESALYWLAFPGLPPRRAVVASLAANTASVVVGEVVRAVFGGV